MAQKRRKKTVRETRFLLSSGSPLTPAEKRKLKGELGAGTVKTEKKLKPRKDRRKRAR